jgi:uncharacterized protein YjiS (DUF1127 family)
MFGNGVVRIFSDWQARGRLRQDRSRLHRELLSMSDRQLLDIGISRGDIGAIVRGDFEFNRR